MKVSVVGFWHLGSVIASCLADAGHKVIGLDFDKDNIKNLNKGKAPLYEPGLEALISKGIASKKLRFTSDPSEIKGSEIIWVAFDTPVNSNDVADVDFVKKQVKKLFPYIPKDSTVLISSQVPVGTTNALSLDYNKKFPNRNVGFACSPENLRLGKAIEVFTKPDRVILGIESDSSKKCLTQLFSPFTDKLIWMSVASAELTKHSINAFLALSVTFINEIATLGEAVGADAKEVELGLKSEIRIGERAYLSPGAPFAGGTLARDLIFLEKIGRAKKLPTNLFTAVLASNHAHKLWTRRTLEKVLGKLKGKKITIWGLTYKPDTSTLRKSESVELCKWLFSKGAKVSAHDPAIKTLPKELKHIIKLNQNPIDALEGSDGLVIATSWPIYRSITAETLLSKMHASNVVDPSRFLINSLGVNARIRYSAVGKIIL
jgi:UDPglucose 6-dehydrogenase